MGRTVKVVSMRPQSLVGNGSSSYSATPPRALQKHMGPPTLLPGGRHAPRSLWHRREGLGLFLVKPRRPSSASTRFKERDSLGPAREVEKGKFSMRISMLGPSSRLPGGRHATKGEEPRRDEMGKMGELVWTLRAAPLLRSRRAFLGLAEPTLVSEMEVRRTRRSEA